MTTYALSPLFNGWQGFDSSGRPLTAGTISVYLAGGTTPTPTWTTSAGSVTNSNPIVLNGGGYPPNEIWVVVGTGYKFVVSNASGSETRTYDNITVTDVFGTLADTSSAANGDALIGVKSTLTAGTARTQHDKNADVVSALDFMSSAQISDVRSRTGSIDVTQALINASAALAAGGTLHLPAGVYLINNPLGVAWTVNGNQSVIGDGSVQTTLKFSPGAAGSCLTVSNGASQAILQTVKGLGFYSADSTYTKVALDLYDTSSLVVDDIYVWGTGSGTPNAPYWSGNGASIGIRTHGREAASFSNLRLCADLPIYIDQNPNTVPNDGEDVDHWEFTNLYLSARYNSVSGSNYCITVKDGLGASNMMFNGYQAWVGGGGGIKMNDTRAAPTVVSRNIIFRNVRTEQIQDSAGWAFNLAFTVACQQVNFENIIMASMSKGINIYDNATAGGGALRIGLYDVTAATTAPSYNSLTVAGATSNSVIEMHNCFWQSGSILTLTNYVPTSIAAWNPTNYAGPSTATYAFTSTLPYSNWMVLGKNAAAASCPADTSEDILATITIKAGTMGPYGALRVRTQWSTTNNANVKTARIRLGGIGGTDFLAQPLTNFASTVNETVIQNRNSQASQYGPPAAMAGGFGQSAGTPITGAIDTSVDTTLVITGQKATNGDTLTLISYIVECAAG